MSAQAANVLEFQVLGFGVEGDKTKHWAYFTCNSIEAARKSMSFDRPQDLLAWLPVHSSYMKPAKNDVCAFNPAADLLSDIAKVEQTTSQYLAIWRGTLDGRTRYFLSNRQE